MDGYAFSIASIFSLMLKIPLLIFDAEGVDMPMRWAKADPLPPSRALMMKSLSGLQG